MRRSLMLFAAAVLLASTAAAQNASIAAATSPTPAPALTLSDASPQMGPASVRDDFPWQLSMGYQYMYFDFAHSKASMNGSNTTIVRFLTDHLAVEGSVDTEFGALNSAIYGRMFLYDGGIRWTARRSGKWEPWAHADGGGVHLRETAFSGPFSFNGFSMIAGGGLDYAFRRRFSIRMQADYIGTRINGTFQNSVSAGAGFVVNF
jgi:hypothetical protein